MRMADSTNESNHNQYTPGPPNNNVGLFFAYYHSRHSVLNGDWENARNVKHPAVYRTLP